MNLQNKYLKYKKKYIYLKNKNIIFGGGGILNIFDKNYLDTLNCLIKSKIYDYIYVSIGSFYREEKFNKIATNSIYQMIPIFIRNRMKKKILNIIIDDDFNSINQELLNKTLINHINIDTYILDIKDIENIDDKITFEFNFIKKLVSYLYDAKFEEKNLVIANFIKFIKNFNRPPNEKELDNKIFNLLEEQYKIILDKKDLEEDIKKYNYSNSYYVWMGYDIYFYNYLYHYNSESSNIFLNDKDKIYSVSKNLVSNYTKDSPIGLILDFENNNILNNNLKIIDKTINIPDNNDIIQIIKNLFCFYDTSNIYENSEYVNNEFVLDMNTINQKIIEKYNLNPELEI